MTFLFFFCSFHHSFAKRLRNTNMILGEGADRSTGSGAIVRIFYVARKQKEIKVIKKFDIEYLQRYRCRRSSFVRHTNTIRVHYTHSRSGARAHYTFLKNILSFHTVMGFLNTVTEPSRSVPPNRYTEHSLTGWYSPPLFARPIADARPALEARATALVDDTDRTSAELELNAVDELSANVLGGAGRFISRISNALSLSSSRLSGGLFNLT